MSHESPSLFFWVAIIALHTTTCLRAHCVRAREQLRCARAERIGALAQRAEQLRVNATEQHALIALRVVGGLGPRAGRARQ
jgi:hypothetical protein